MKKSFNIAQRKPVWLALSDLYLDTELSNAALKHIALIIKESPYTLDEIKQINKYEVFPILQPNLLSTTGVWDGFKEDWLIEKIVARTKSKNLFKDARLELNYLLLKSMYRSYWQRLERVYKQL